METSGNKYTNKYKDKYCKRNKEDKDKLIETEIANLGLTEQYNTIKQTLTNERPKRILKALLINNKDKDKAINYLQEKIKAKDNRKENRINEINKKIEELKLDSKMNELFSLNLKDRKIISALKKNNNDPDKALLYLKSKTENKDNINFKKEDKYKLMFPNDDKIDWDKYRQTKDNKRKEKLQLKLKSKYPNMNIDINDKEQMKKLKFDLSLEKEKDKIERDKHSIKQLNNNIKLIYLDGNNMLFSDNLLRNESLKSLSKGSKKLVDISSLYSELQKINITLIFDNNKELNTDKTSNGVKYKVITARPDFETSDDALVEWVGGYSANDFENTLFVTSDRELQTRLIKKGAKYIMKSGDCLDLMKNKITEENYNKLFV
jgi:predicted RNA-binding protein with PIN domain